MVGVLYVFCVIQLFEFDDVMLLIVLMIENVGCVWLLFGFGVYLFLVCDVVIELVVVVGGLWLLGVDFLLVWYVSVLLVWQFGVVYLLLVMFVNYVFIGWGGYVMVSWLCWWLLLIVVVDVDVYVFYMLLGEDFFCFELVDYLINVVNLLGGVVVYGMMLFVFGEWFMWCFVFIVECVDVCSNVVIYEGCW